MFPLARLSYQANVGLIPWRCPVQHFHLAPCLQTKGIYYGMLEFQARAMDLQYLQHLPCCWCWQCHTTQKIPTTHFTRGLMVDITKSWEVCYESIDFLYTSWQFWRKHCCHQAREDAETAVRELDHRRVLLACLPDGSKPWWPKTNKNSCEIDVHPQSIWSHTFFVSF